MQTLKRHLGGLGTVGTDRDCELIVKSNFDHSTPTQRCCSIIFDEVYARPSLRFTGCHIVGFAEDAPEQLAHTVLVMMVKPFMGASPFVARLAPTFSLQPQFLFDQVVRLIQIVYQNGGSVVSLICDNHFTNRNCFQLFQPNAETPWRAENPENTEQPLFLLYDTVHLLKNIRNN
jgi:hypothetical protein